MVRRTIRDGTPRLIIDFRYTDKSGKRCRFRRDAEVQTLDAARREDVERQELAATTGSPERHKAVLPTFATFVEQWQALYLPRYRPATRERYKAMLGQGLLDHFGPLTLDRIGAATVLPFLVELSRRRGGKGVQARPHVNLLKTILRAAVEVGVLPTLPALPAAARSPRRIKACPTPAELDGWLASADGWLRLAIALAGLAGLRQGEVRALEVRDVDLREDVLLVRRAFSGGEVLEPKGCNERRVPIAPTLRPALVQAVKGKLPQARLVVRPNGQTPSRQAVLSDFKQLQGGKGWSFHSLRHHCLTYLLRRGADVRSVMAAAGHSSLAVTSGYLHGSEDAIRVAMGRATEGK